MLMRSWRWIQILMAGHGAYRYEGSTEAAKLRHPKWPFAHVIYDDGKRSAEMPLGNALDYLHLWGGTIDVQGSKFRHPGFVGRSKK